MTLCPLRLSVTDRVTAGVEPIGQNGESQVTDSLPRFLSWLLHNYSRLLSTRRHFYSVAFLSSAIANVELFMLATNGNGPNAQGLTDSEP